MAKGFFVAALARQGVVDVGHCHDLRGNGNILTLQAVRVAAAVPALVMPAADGVGCLDQRRLLLEGELVENFRTGGGVGLHRVKLFLRQFAGLVQNRLRDVDLADVVQRRRRADQRNIGGVQIVFVGFPDQRAQQDAGRRLDVQHVQAALAVAELDDMAENVDHRRVAFLFFVDLLGHQPHQVLLLGVEHQGVDDAAVHNGHIKRAADVVSRAQIVGTLHIAGCVLGRDHNDRDIVDPVIFIHHGQHVKAVHFGHHDIQQQQVNVDVGLHDGHCLAAVLGFEDFVTVAQHLRQDSAVHCGIVRYQDLFFFVHGHFTYT